jgi:hypothetical protein
MSMVEQQLWEEGRDQVCVKREKRGSFYRRGGGRPLGGAAALWRNSPPLHFPLHGGNPLINMR